MASIRKNKKAYNVIYSYTNENGERKQKWETYHSEAEAKKRKAEIEFKENMGKLIIPTCSTINELSTEYVSLYGRTKWSMMTYSANTSLIDHYISPIIGEMKLREITPRVLEKYYQKLARTPAVRRASDGKYDNINRFVEKATIVRVHKLLNSMFTQAMKWDLMEKNPASLAAVPKHEQQKREIWDIDTLRKVNDICKDQRLKLCINMAFACSLRIGELLALTWDCVDISDESIENGNPSIFINKELQRVSKIAFKALDEKDVISVFPEVVTTSNKTIRLLKTPKTPTSVRKVFLPQAVAEMLIDWKKDQDEIKEALGSEYADYNLVIANSQGGPTEAKRLEERFKKLIKNNNLPDVCFHSLRHSSITYKLKLTGGDIKAVQGDSGHAQAKMITDQYSHILDDSRRENAHLLQNAFYAAPKEKAKPAPVKPENPSTNEKITPEMVTKLMDNPEVVDLLLKISKAYGKE